MSDPPSEIPGDSVQPQPTRLSTKPYCHGMYEYNHIDNVSLDAFFSIAELTILLPSWRRDFTAGLVEDVARMGQQAYVKDLLNRAERGSRDQRVSALESIAFLALRGLEDGRVAALENNSLLFETGTLRALFRGLRSAQEGSRYTAMVSSFDSVDIVKELNLYLITIYLIVEFNYQHGRFANRTVTLDPTYVDTLFTMTLQLNEKEQSTLCKKKLIMLLWKVIMVIFGGLKEANQLKTMIRHSRGLATATNVKCSLQQLYTFEKNMAMRFPTYIPQQRTSVTDNSIYETMRIANAICEKVSPCQQRFPTAHDTNDDTAIEVDDDLKDFSDNDDARHPLLQSCQRECAFVSEAKEIHKKYLYISLSDQQLSCEKERVSRGSWPLQEEPRDTRGKHGVDEATIQEGLDTVEHVYVSLYPKLPEVIQVLLRCCLANALRDSTPSSPSEVKEDVENAADTCQRCDREIVLAAVSAILLLMLKWFKVSHVLKYEYLSQLLVDSGCLVLILEIFGSQDMVATVTKKTGCYHDRQSEHRNSLPRIPQGNQRDNSPCHARNMFWSINLLRVMQALTKDKVHRTLMLTRCNAATVLTRLLKIRHPMVELYTLKNLKNQVAFLGKRWRLSNMRIISSIYHHCRPRLDEDWLATKEVSEVSINTGKEEEAGLRALICFYLERCYGANTGPSARQTAEDVTLAMAREIQAIRLGNQAQIEAMQSTVANCDGWDAPVMVPPFASGDWAMNANGEVEEEPEHGPLEGIDWSSLTEDDLQRRMARIEANPVQRWLNIDINDPRYIKVLDPFQLEEDGDQ